MPHGMAKKQKKKMGKKVEKLEVKLRKKKGGYIQGYRYKNKKKTRNGERMIEKKYDSMWGGKISQIN